MDRRWYLDVNRFAARTAWAHGVAAFFARPLALGILAFLVLIALARARVAGFGGTDIDKIAVLLWAGLGTAFAYAVSLPVVHLVARARPFAVVPSALVLLAKPTGFSFPNEHAVIASAVATGLWLSRARLLAAMATLLAIIVALAVVYSGTAYPSDAAAGLLIGTLVSLVVYPFAVGSLRALVHLVARSPLAFLVGGGRHRRPVGPGPAAHPELVGESGGFRILPSDEASTGRIPPDRTRTVRTVPQGGTRTVRVLPTGQTGNVRIVQPHETSSARTVPPDKSGTGTAGTAPDLT